ncbi:hypothetical protein [Yoonia sp.]|uniref:hypothetical protein n=1 Tax=Yoonia sp. TaxID=2212373 RepID=UPI002FDB0664
MLYRLPGALVRAIIVALLVITPYVLLDGRGSESTPIVALAAVFAALLTIVEYSASSPSVVEFRDAPPFNRVRFAALFSTILCLSVIFRGQEVPNGLSDFFVLSGSQIGKAIDFPLSPARMMLDLLPADTSPAEREMIRSAAGLAYLLVSFSVIWFVVLLRLYRWPRRSDAFNVWVNLPTFDPTSGGDVIRRLRWDGRFNVLLGLATPYLVPGLIYLVGVFGTPINLGSSQTLIWTIATWAFLPANLLMRGIAISRIAYMIELQRRRAQGDRGAGIRRYV